MNMLDSKKGQLMALEIKLFLIGFGVGLAVAIVAIVVLVLTGAMPGVVSNFLCR